MNDDLKSMMDDLLSPDILQPKIDILESNITGDLIISEDELEAVTIIQREGTGAVTEIMDKAVKQFLSNLNIFESIISSELSTALETTGDEDVHLQFSIRDQEDSKQARHLEIIVAKTQIKIMLRGYAAIEPLHEAITKYYFEHKHYPGKILPNGKFDYRELYKFPSVKQNDKLLFIRYPVPGKPGVTYSGRPLIVAPPNKLELLVKEGIVKKKLYNDKKQPVGELLTAFNDGVIIITKTNDIISEIDVSNEIKLDKIDFSTGNIGSEFKSPVSMEIGEISCEFKVNVDGRIKVNDLNGGTISTNKNAVAENVRNNSFVTAQRNIKSKTVSDSSLESIKGAILIEGELRDSRLKSPTLHFLCKKGLMLNNKIMASECILEGGYYCGVNTIILGKPLFEKRLQIIDAKNEYEQKINQINNAIGEIKAKLVPTLKDIASQISDEKTMNQYKILIRYFQALEFNETFTILDELRKKLNVMQIDTIKKLFENLNSLSKKIIDVEAQLDKCQNNLFETESAINKIKFHVKGEINPTATIKFFCNKRMEENEPVFEITSTNNNKNEAIDISGSYTLDRGFHVD